MQQEGLEHWTRACEPPKDRRLDISHSGVHVVSPAVANTQRWFGDPCTEPVPAGVRWQWPGSPLCSALPSPTGGGSIWLAANLQKTAGSFRVEFLDQAFFSSRILPQGGCSGRGCYAFLTPQEGFWGGCGPACPPGSGYPLASSAQANGTVPCSPSSPAFEDGRILRVSVISAITRNFPTILPRLFFLSSLRKFLR